jgi:hypothetical protein
MKAEGKFGFVKFGEFLDFPVDCLCLHKDSSSMSLFISVIS